MSRERILADLRAALAHPTPASFEYPVPRIERPSPPSASSLADQFKARFEALGGIWHEAGSGDEVADAVGPLVPAGRAVLVSQDSAGRLARLGVADALHRRGNWVVTSLAEVPPNEIQVTVTGVTLAIADSGTLGVLAAPGQGRLASLIAPVHVAVVARSQLVATQGEYLAAARAALASGASSAAILITGPSRTGDIEGQLIVGVHGPGQIHTVLVDG